MKTTRQVVNNSAINYREEQHLEVTVRQDLGREAERQGSTVNCPQEQVMSEVWESAGGTEVPRYDVAEGPLAL